MKSLAKICIVLLLAGALFGDSAAQTTRKQIPTDALKTSRVVKQPDITIWTMKATLAYTNVGSGVATPIDRVKLEFTFKNIGDGDLPNLAVDVSFYKNDHHLDTWSLAKLAPGETKQWWDYREFNHGEKVTFAVQIRPGPNSTPVESPRAMSNNRREIVLGEAEDTILHAGGEIHGQFTQPQ
jgi:hypothetical protein